MESICRLCCSTKFVNNNLFDEENALYLKMELYLPIKVIFGGWLFINIFVCYFNLFIGVFWWVWQVKKLDRLPQRVCDRCSCKVNDLYQFCNEAIEAQHRLVSHT